MFSRILVPLDGSALAERTIPHAEQFARLFGADIILLQVLEPTSYHENPIAVDPLSWQIRKAEAEIYMQGIVARIRENLGEPPPNAAEEHKDRVTYAIREGKISENIVDFAHAEKIDLLVISTHGSGGLSRWGMSSVAQKVTNLIYLNVLLVRAFCQSEDDRSVYYRRILLPIDNSRRAELSLSAGIALSQGEVSQRTASLAETTENPKLVLAAVIKPPDIPIPKPYPAEIDGLSEQLMRVSRNAVKTYLDMIQERLPVESEACVVESDNVTAAIQELADKEGIDLIVLSAHGYSGQLTPYGAVTRSYMEYGTKSVLIIQDVPLSEAKPTAAGIAAEECGRR
ncbi:MAG: universal stress protein [Anaerolineae bacterium]